MTKDNAGHNNVGSNNVGDSNTGSKNYGHANTGNNNCGSLNTGDNNIGNLNTGDHNGVAGDIRRPNTVSNTGNRNSGSYNVGNRNSGNGNRGSNNLGQGNTGDSNLGNFNTGQANLGSFNAGGYNTGNFNTGWCNAADYSSGFFCTEEPEVLLFDKPSGLKRAEVIELLESLEFEPATQWVMPENMTDAEKEKYPLATHQRGYLKKLDLGLKEQFCLAWEKLPEEQRQKFLDLPNFDAEKFYRCTGVRVDQDRHRATRILNQYKSGDLDLDTALDALRTNDDNS